jgi:pre-rRNA-processing protein TSR3
MIRAHVIRHSKERLTKCSLQPVIGRDDLCFYTARGDFCLNADGMILLGVGAPELTSADAGCPILLLDSTWRLLPELERRVIGSPIRRSLPVGIRTAYPRVSKTGKDPDCGLASIEALYCALKIIGFDDHSLLADYYWKDAFLAQFSR